MVNRIDEVEQIKEEVSKLDKNEQKVKNDNKTFNEAVEVFKKFFSAKGSGNNVGMKEQDNISEFSDEEKSVISKLQSETNNKKTSSVITPNSGLSRDFKGSKAIQQGNRSEH